jgi:DNA-binding NtrC family response regulator
MSDSPKSGRQTEPAVTGRARVLVVDDENPVLVTTAALLADDYDVETAHSGISALALMERTPIDVVCTDLTMPGINGLELLRRVSTMPGHIGRVLITGFRDYAEREAVDAQPWFLVVKPYQATHLLRIVQRAWSGTQLRRTAAEVRRLAHDDVAERDSETRIPGAGSVRAQRQ